jgi:hypothetical protein
MASTDKSFNSSGVSPIISGIEDPLYAMTGQPAFCA